MTDTDCMVVWLREAMDAAQRDAEAAGGDAWRLQDHPSDIVAIYDSKGEPVVYDEGWPTEAQKAHIVRHAPAAVLRRIAADRKTLARHQPKEVCGIGPAGGILACSYDPHPWPCPDIIDLAEGYGWAETQTAPNWPECMCTSTGECGRCWEKRHEATNAHAVEGAT